LNVRPYTMADLGAVVALFTASVHELGATYYSAEQRNAWAPRSPDMAAWALRLAELQTLLLLDESGLAGFVSYEVNGHLDLLYTAPRTARQGVASRLLKQVEQALPGVEQFTEASLIAKPFFLRHGFQVTEAQVVVRRGVSFSRFAMHKGVEGQAKEGV
jgi:putative acetyltransferase